MVYYFAYGSNMDKDDLDEWCENKRYQKIKFLNVSPVKLNGYELRFNYFSTTRNGGAANIMESKNSCVYGLLIELENEALEIIREKESYPNFYNEITIDVEQFDSTVIHNVKTYKVVRHREKSEHQPPTGYYVQLIIKNAKKYNFPIEYMEFLGSIRTK